MAAANSVVGSVAALWRYPVKSMQGEELNASEVTEHGLLGDRTFALVDAADGKLGSAKNPRKWPNLFAFRAAFTAAPRRGDLPPVRITLPSGASLLSEQADRDELLSAAVGRGVSLREVVPERPVLEAYWPDLEGLDHRDAVTDYAMPPGYFFDVAPVHVLTTATLARLRELYPAGRFELPRFRPNVVVACDGSGFVEQDWVGRSLALGDGVRLQITAACSRCVMITLPQGDLPRDVGILRTAVQHTRGQLGVYASVLQGGTVRQGDAVRLE
jgi:uncharacterized protein YcbX